MAKKIISLFLCLVMFFSVAACGSGENPATDPVGTGSNSAAESSTGINSDADSDGNSDADSDGNSDANIDVGTNSDAAPDQSDAASDNVTDTATDGGTSDGETDSATDGQESTDSEQEEVYEILGEEDYGRKFIACDIVNFSIVVYDLDACGGDYQRLTDDKTAVVWEWGSTYDPNCKTGPRGGLSSAKLRYSPYYKRDVIIACSSNGWWGVIDYQRRKLLCEGKLISGPHSIEMLPNGDLVVGVSNNPMGVYYIPLSAGIFEPVHSIESHSCHGVCWDPTRECLWVLDYDEVYAVTVENMGTAQAKLVRDETRVCTFKADGKDYHDGHALSPVAGSPGKYWVSTVKYLWIFDSETMEMTREFDRYATLNRRSIKGIASYEDGTVVETVHNLGGGAVNFYACDGFRVISPTVGQDGQTVDVVTNAVFPYMGRQFYKIQPFTKNYQ